MQFRFPRVTPSYAAIASAVAEHGLAARGGFVPTADDGVPQVPGETEPACVVMIGNTGRAMWDAFAPHRDGAPHPLDRWTRAVIEPIAARFGATAVYPFQSPPLPFQRWAKRAWPIFPSPLGLMIDTEYGLWHALRAALLFPVLLDLPEQPHRTSPCDACAAKPCLAACPVDAFTLAGFDYVSCRTFLATTEGNACMAGGCRARAACPVACDAGYGEAQAQFHMQAFRG